MIFLYTCHKVIIGTKTQTRRRAGGKQRYFVGKTYAVQPGRGKASLGRIRITEIREIGRAWDIPEPDAWAEGYETQNEFRATWAKMYGAAALDESCIALTFELVEATHGAS